MRGLPASCFESRPDGREVGVWWLRVDDIDASCHARWYAMLDARERERARRFFFDHDRLEFVACHALLRSKLSTFAGGSPCDWKFSSDTFGKPQVSPEQKLPDLQFNISHTRGLVAVAITWEAEVGIDVEVIKSFPDQQDIADRYFAASEVELLLKTPLLERPRAFARLWTLKEAYLKATGLGLNAQLETFAFQLEPLHVVFGPEISDRPEMWQFVSALVTSQHVLSIAVRQSGDRQLPVMLQEVCSADL